MAKPNRTTSESIVREIKRNTTTQLIGVSTSGTGGHSDGSIGVWFHSTSHLRLCD
jgi:hypothetical protein